MRGIWNRRANHAVDYEENMRARPRTDRNQSQIVKELRQMGYSVLSLASIGKGCPDILVGKAFMNYVFEIKDPERSPSERRLTDDEETFHTLWRGQIAVIETTEEALKLMGVK